MIRKLLFYFVLAITTQLSFAQAPGADCGSATALTLIPGGTISTGPQTASSVAPNFGTAVSDNACVTGAGFYGDGTHGVYSINVVTTGLYTFEFTNSGSTWKVLTVHSGCLPTGANCEGGFITGGARAGSNQFTLTPGTYYIIVDSWGALTPSADFELLVTSPIPNDEPCGAIALPVNADFACASTTFGSVDNATDSGIDSCGFSNPDNDIWYSFVATATSHRVSLLNVAGSDTDMYHAVYGPFISPDCTVGTGDNISCSDADTSDVTGLIIGRTYFVQVFTYFSGPEDTQFDICIGTPPPPPAYDDPCTAQPLTVDTTCSFTTYTTQSATTTATAGIPAPGCANYNGGDVWFTVTVPASGNVIVDSDTGIITDGGMAIYSQNSACPGLNLTLIECDDDDSANGLMSRIELFGQPPGATLYVRFWEYGNNNNGTFDICAYEPTPPVNDDCANAILLTSDSNCVSTTGTTEYATQSQVGCIGNADDDVWYSFIATGTEHTITVSPNTLWNAVFQVFEGSCGGPSLSCVNATFGTTDETITLTTLTPGTAYYIRVYTNGGAVNQGLFEICITEPCVLPAITLAPPTCTLIADDTNNNPFTTIPFVADPQVSIDCDTGEAILEAYSNFHETTDYRVERIPYSVNSGLGGGLTNQVIPNDDVWASSSTNIGFDFCFYGQTYTHFLVGANAKVTFDINDPGNGLTGANTPGSFSGWQFDENLPSTDGSLVDHAIYGVYHDIDPRGLVGNPIQTELVGTGNCRKMVISWTDIPMFSDATRLYSGRIELYENTNIIEVHIEEKLIENGNSFPWNDGNAIVGIQGNSAAGEAVTAPCRGIDPNWEVLNTPTTREAWRFVPDGAARVPSTVTWYTGSVGGTQVGTNNTLTVNTADTYYVEATYPTCSGSITVDDAIIVTDPRKIWDGSVDNNWYVDGNWTPSGVPDLNDCVVIPDDATTPNDPIAEQLNAAPLPPTTPAMARNLTLQPGAYLEVATNTELLVRDWVNVQNTGILNIESSGSLIQMEDTAVNTGNIHMQRSPRFDESAVGGTEYVYWSSPVANKMVTTISPSSSLIYGWTPTAAGNGAGNHGEWFGASGVMNDATGYIIAGLGGTPGTIPSTGYAIPGNTALFSGVPNNGVYTKPIFHGNYNAGPYAGIGNTATNEDDNWNLLGNPYPSAISANAFTNLNTNINGTVYVWPHSSTYSAITGDPFYEDYAYNYDGNDYIEHNNTGSNPPGTNDLFIGSGQGFFVLMNHGAASGTDVTFNNSMRYDNTIDDLIINYDNSNFFRMNTEEYTSEDTIERHRIWIDLLSPNAITNSILVGYIDNATNEFDRLYDGYDFSGDDSGFYSIVNDEGLSIQGRALPFLQQDRVSLGVVANETGSHTIAINTVDGLFLDDTQGIYIEDTQMNIIHDLRNAPYTFTITEGTHDDRFVLRYTDDTLSVNSFDSDNITIVAPNGEYIKVTSSIGMIDTVKVFDIIGKVIFAEQDLNTSEFILNETKLSEGVYIVKATLSNGKQKLQKVVLRR